jgi:hypothetical protein
MHEGFAELRQELTVRSGGFLEFWPELFIPQGGTRFRQKTTINVEDGGELLFFESLAPGRVAAGESFAFRELEWATDVRFAGALVARERYRISPGDESVRTLQRAFTDAYYASGFIVSPKLTDKLPCWQQLHELQTKDALDRLRAARLRRVGGQNTRVLEHRSPSNSPVRSLADLFRAWGRHAICAADLMRTPPLFERAPNLSWKPNRGITTLRAFRKRASRFTRPHEDTYQGYRTRILLPACARAGSSRARDEQRGEWIFASDFRIDHLLAMIAVGLWAGQLGGRARWQIPVAFLGVMILGGALGMAGIAVPAVEQGLVASVLILGVLIAAAVRLPAAGQHGSRWRLRSFPRGSTWNRDAGRCIRAELRGGFLSATALLHVGGLALGTIAKAR